MSTDADRIAELEAERDQLAQQLAAATARANQAERQAQRIALFVEACIRERQYTEDRLIEQGRRDDALWPALKRSEAERILAFICRHESPAEPQPGTGSVDLDNLPGRYRSYAGGYSADQSIEQVARWYEVETAEVERAIRLQLKRLWKRDEDDDLAREQYERLERAASAVLDSLYDPATDGVDPAAFNALQEILSDGDNEAARAGGEQS